VKVVDVALAVVWRGGRLFLQRRDPAGAVLPGRWELPGGKVEAAETCEVALQRELQEEVALSAGILRGLPVREHIYPGLKVRLHPFLVRAGGDPRTPLAWGWFTPAEALRLPLPEANLMLFKELRAPAGEDPE
jgi:mutator protein MutT